MASEPDDLGVTDEPFEPVPPGTPDDRLADLIEADAREQLGRGRGVTLERYMAAVPDLGSRAVALDAAIEFVLRSAALRGVKETAAAEELASRHPELRAAVHRAVLLGDVGPGPTLGSSVGGMLSAAASGSRGGSQGGSVGGSLGAAGGAGEKRGRPPEVSLPLFVGPPTAEGRARYELAAKIGDGSYGAVYRAYDHAMRERGNLLSVAVKRHAPADPRLDTDEATRARRIEHVNVVRVYDRGLCPDGWAFTVQELVEGGSLETVYAARSGPMSGREAAEIVRKVARGVHAAHLMGLVHCDLKPANVLMTKDHVPKVADFGVASHLGDGSEAVQRARPVGSLGFAAPELLQAVPGARAIPADVYGLGAILYYLLTGRMVNGGTAQEVLANLNKARSLEGLEGVDGDLRHILRRALSVDPMERQPSAEAFARDLEDYLAYRPIEWAPNSALHRFRLLAWRRPRTVALTFVAIVAIGGVTVVAVRATLKARFTEELIAASQNVADARQRTVEVERSRQALVAAVAGSAYDVMGGSMAKHLNEWAWSPQLTVVESVVGPQMIRAAGDKAAVVEDLRIHNATLTLNELKAQGQGESVEALFWRDGIAYWSLYRGKNAEALAMLDEGEAIAARMLPEKDRWRQIRAALRAMAETRLAEQAGGQTREQVEARLKGALEGLPRTGNARGVTYMVVQELTDLYAKGGTEADRKKHRELEATYGLMIASIEKGKGSSGGSGGSGGGGTGSGVKPEEKKGEKGTAKPDLKVENGSPK